MIKRLLVCTTFILSIHAVAGTKVKKQRAEFDSSKTVQVKYGSSKWNKDPSQVDSGVVVLRDSASNKTMQVQLEETAPDSGVYSGTYSISWGGDASIKPEVYVLEERELLSEKELKRVLEDISQGKIKRKPLFYKKNEVGTQVLEVFDSKEQAQEALNLLRQQNQKGNGLDVSSVTSKDYATAKAIMDSQELAQFAQENELRRQEVQKRVVDRYRLEQTERNRIEKFKKDFNQLDEAGKKKKISEAEQFAEAGSDFFKANQLDAAEDNFRKSFILNPTTMKSYFLYGTALYKNQKYNAAVIVFNIAKDDPTYTNEALYYAGLSHYEMKEYESALSTFEKLKASKDPKLAPLANFYCGLIYYNQKGYEKSKAEFETVLDTSKDPKLDKSAEGYIDNINQLLQLGKIKERKVFLSGSLGALYDSNVLQQSDSSADSGGALQEKSLRYIVGLGAFYRPVYTKAYEFGVKARTDYIYTQNSDATDYDPWSIQASTPFVYKSALFGKSYKLDLTPGYELLYLGQDETSGDPEKTLNGYYLDVGNTFIMQNNWFSNYTLTFRKDNFIQSDEQGKTATKITFKWTNTFFLNQANTKGIVGALSYITNDADDSAYTYQRYDLSALYLTPVFKDAYTFAGGLSAYILDYKERNKDFNKTLNLTLSKPIRENITGTLLGTYVLNDSDTASYEYDKWTLGFLFTAEYGF